MNQQPDTLIIPVENQVRELDAKLFLAGVAAARGYQVFLGSRAYIHFEMARFPAGIYVAKSMRSLSALMFRIIAGLGHRIIAWGEEALVHPPAETFYTLRLSPKTIRYVSDLFCWGKENRDLMLVYEHLTSATKLHVTGNPRGDMLRSEFRPYFQAQADDYIAKYGEFVLLNTNFSGVNPYIRSVGLFKDDELTKLGQAGKGMSMAFTRGLFHHKTLLYRAFLALTERLAEARPDTRFIIRPHPSESREPYLALSARFDNVETIAEGNVLPWLLAAKLLVHNGCTTAVEAFALDVPSISYMPITNDLYDYDFQGFPNRISQTCDNADELIGLIDNPDAIWEAQCTNDRRALLTHHIASLKGPFASDQIIDVLTKLARPEPPARSRRYFAVALAVIKRELTLLKMGHRSGSNRLGYHDLRFPEISASELQERLARMARMSGRFGELSVIERSRHIFEIRSL